MMRTYISFRSRRIGNLILGDFKNITRDEILVFALAAPFLLAVVFRYGIPLVAGLLLQHLHFDLRPHYPFIAGFLIMLPPMIYGMIYGFIILEERDEQILTYLSVTPLSRSGYLAYRITAPVILSFLFGVLLLWFTALVPFQPLKVISVSVVAALEAPLMTLFLACFAANKVEGLALSKGFGVMYAGSFVGYFVKSNWQLLAGVLPPYWVTQALVAERGFWWYIIGGVVVHLGYVFWLMARFGRKSFEG